MSCRENAVKLQESSVFNALATMKPEIIRIEKRIVTCEMENGGLIDIAKRWFNEDIQVGDTIEFEYRHE